MHYFGMEMALVDVARIVGIEGMVVDIDMVEGTSVVVAGFHNHIPSNIV